MSPLDEYKNDFVLFVEMGFVAINQADEDAALKLFRAAEALDPSSTLPQVGFGYLHLHKLELKQAIASFENVLAKEPSNEMAKTLLGIALSFSPDKVAEGEKILTDAAKASGDETVKKTASDAIAFVDAFIKKSPSPAEVQQRKPAK
jgi:tetratricopeptide (TPR) repeat protein